MVGPIRRISCSKLQQLGSDHLVLSGDMLQSRGLENYSTMRVQDIIPEPHSVLSYPTAHYGLLYRHCPVEVLHQAVALEVRVEAHLSELLRKYRQLALSASQGNSHCHQTRKQPQSPEDRRNIHQRTVVTIETASPPKVVQPRACVAVSHPFEHFHVRFTNVLKCIEACEVVAELHPVALLPTESPQSLRLRPNRLGSHSITQPSHFECVYEV